MKFRIIISILAAILLIFTVSYFVYQKYYQSQPTEQSPEPLTEKLDEITKPKSENPKDEVKPIAPTVINGYKLYKNTEFGFEIQYPTSWTVTEKIEENVRGEMVKEFFFGSPSSDLRFAVLPRDGLSYGLGAKGTSTPVFIGGSSGMQTQYVLKDSRRLW